MAERFLRSPSQRLLLANLIDLLVLCNNSIYLSSNDPFNFFANQLRKAMKIIAGHSESGPATELETKNIKKGITIFEIGNSITENTAAIKPDQSLITLKIIHAL